MQGEEEESKVTTDLRSVFGLCPEDWSRASHLLWAASLALFLFSFWRQISLEGPCRIQTYGLPASVSQVAGIVGLSHKAR